MSESFAELFEQSLTNLDIVPGTIIEAEVLSIDGDFVVVDAGLKSEAVIPVGQFKDKHGELTIAVGDQVEVALDAIEDSTGETRLSRDKAKRAKMWQALEAAFEAEETIQGRITGKVKGGFTMDLDGIRAFLPGSLVDVRPLRDTAFLEDRDLDLKLIKIDAKRNNIVVSRRAVIEAENSVEREALLENLAEDQEIKGIVKNLTDYGVFVDLGGIDGLLHITDMSWKRIKHPSELVAVGDEMTVKVLKFDRERSRVSLGLKQLGMDPWRDLLVRFPEGKKVKGTVSNIADYGCFVDLGEGVEGLVHVSEMDWTNRNVNPSKIVSVGQDVDVMILEVDEQRRRISLGLKQCINNPWEEFANAHREGDRVSGVIKSITDFGIFLGLTEDIDGLIHLSDLSWTQPGEQVVREFNKGDQLEAIVLGVDVERERISLGLKQLADDPLSQYSQAQAGRKAVKATALEVDEKGAHFELEGGVKAYMRAGDMARERVEDARHQINVGDEVEALITGIDRKTSVVNLSIRALHENEEKQATEAYRSSSDSATTSTTLGALIKEKMEGKGE